MWEEGENNSDFLSCGSLVSSSSKWKAGSSIFLKEDFLLALLGPIPTKWVFLKMGCCVNLICGNFIDAFCTSIYWILKFKESETLWFLNSQNRIIFQQSIQNKKNLISQSTPWPQKSTNNSLFQYKHLHCPTHSQLPISNISFPIFINTL